MVAFAECDPLTSAVLTTLIATGIRKGECLGLRWSDIDLDARTAHVRRVLSRTRKRGDAPTSFLVESTKTASSDRIVNLGPSAVTALRRWRVAQAELRMKAPTEPLGWGLGRWPDDLVFTGPAARHSMLRADPADVVRRCERTRTRRLAPARPSSFGGVAHARCRCAHHHGQSLARRFEHHDDARRVWTLAVWGGTRRC